MVKLVGSSWISHRKGEYPSFTVEYILKAHSLCKIFEIQLQFSSYFAFVYSFADWYVFETSRD